MHFFPSDSLQVDLAWNRGDGVRARFHSRCALAWNVVVLLCLLSLLTVALVFLALHIHEALLYIGLQ